MYQNELKRLEEAKTKKKQTVIVIYVGPRLQVRQIVLKNIIYL